MSEVITEPCLRIPVCSVAGCEHTAEWVLVGAGSHASEDAEIDDSLCCRHWAALRNRDPDRAYTYSAAHVIFGRWPDAV